MSTMTTTLSPTVRLAPVRDLRPVPASPRPATAPLRLTRRGRAVLVGLALAVVMVLGVFFGAGSVATDEPGTPVPSTVVMVGQGETLWGIASAAAGDGSTRAMISEIARLNALDSSMVTAGQKLRIPVGD